MNIRLSLPLVVTVFLSSLAAATAARVVNLKDLDLSRDADVRTLYVRIGNAAWNICGELIPASNGPGGISNARCRRTLVDSAVSDVNHPALTAYHTRGRQPFTASR